MADDEADTPWSGKTYRRRKLKELQRLIDLIDRQFVEPVEEGTRSKVADLRARILALMQEYQAKTT